MMIEEGVETSLLFLIGVIGFFFFPDILIRNKDSRLLSLFKVESFVEGQKKTGIMTKFLGL